MRPLVGPMSFFLSFTFAKKRTSLSQTHSKTDAKHVVSSVRFQRKGNQNVSYVIYHLLTEVKIA